MGGMEKTTVYLTSDQKAALAQAAQAEGRSEARLIRAGIDVVTARHRAGESSLEFAPDIQEIEPTAQAIGRPRWIDREAFVRLTIHRQADAELRAELREIAPGTTDDETLP
jgi:hypothetical protein